MADRQVSEEPKQLRGGPETLLHRGAGRDLPPNPSRRGPARSSSSGAGAPAAPFAPSSWPEEVAALRQVADELDAAAVALSPGRVEWRIRVDFDDIRHTSALGRRITALASDRRFRVRIDDRGVVVSRVAPFFEP